jgi:hypothetical protein
MLGITSLLALIGLIIIVFSVILLIIRKNQNLAVVSFITGLVLIFIPGTLIYLFLN